MNKIKYIKDNGSVSDRKVVPVGFDFADRDRVLCIDLSDFSGKELEERKRIVEELRREYIDSIYNAGLKNNFRSFHLDGIEEAE